MKERIGLTGNYIQVRRNKTGEITYGGDQGFFREDADKGSTGKRNINRKSTNRERTAEENLQKQKSGCGLVAFTDIFLYLSNTSRILPEEEYKNYCNQVFRFLGGIRSKNGLSGLKLWFGFNRAAKKIGWKKRAIWGLSGKKLYGRIKEMLERNIPVILCIPMMLLKKDKEDNLKLYRKMESDGKTVYTPVQAVNGHYVTVTGILKEQEECYLEISSWGKQYFINEKEYELFMHSHFLGTILGNLLYIR